MMGEFVGADVDGLDVLARKFESSARKLSELTARSGLMIMVAEWTGADIDRLRAQWDRQIKPGLGNSGAALAALSTSIKQQAQQQRETSTADAGRAGSGSTAGSMSPSQVSALYDAAMKDPSSLNKLSADEVAALWASLSDEQKAALIAKSPLVMGNLSGVPLVDRVEINKINAENRYNEPGVSGAEKAYLKSVFDPKPGSTPVQLVTYDPEHNRIVEMIGTPSADTKHVITYVPGTMTNLDSFYGGGVQQVPHYLVDRHPDTVVLVAKDGAFPGDDGNMPTGILEANQADFVNAPGEALAGLQSDIARDGYLGAAQSTGIGHSWGLANITESETDGAHYDQVVSLSGAWMPKDWSPQAGTSYTDYSYVDILQQAQWMGAVGEGNNPRINPAFEHGSYYQGPEDLVIRGPFGIPVAPNEEHLLNNHNLVASDDANNARVLKDVMHRIYGN